MHFPFRWPAGDIEPEDLGRLKRLFSRSIRLFFPCETISFETIRNGELPAGPRASGLAEAVESGEPVADPAGSTLYLPLKNSGGVFGVAVLGGGGPELYALLRSRRRLLAQSELAARELQLLKQWCTDPATGLLNGCHLREELKIQLAEAGVFPRQLALIEVYPWTRNAEQGLRIVSRIGSHLDSLLSEVALLHHLGSGIFALLLDGDEERILAIGNGVLRWLKREQFGRGHIGFTAVAAGSCPGDDAAEPARQVEEVFERAWQALRVARRRGPHALCSHTALCAREDHPFREPPAKVRTLFRGLWRGRERFALLLLHLDEPAALSDFPERVAANTDLDGVMVPLSPREVYFFLPDADEPQVRRWIERWRENMAALPGTVSIGAALYPCPGFVKADMPVNARKALRHTRFYGPGTGAVFCSVSLNISGDLYYEEGDLARAIREYKLGLALDSRNVNLLNSLGVAYAQANRQKMAIPLFEQALVHEPGNFMALFNLGFAYLASGRTGQAVSCFERALASDAHHFDLLLQLGKIYCQTGRHREAAELLARAEQLEMGDANGVGQGRVYFYLGQAFIGLGQPQQAMTSLQRAIRYNPRDAGAISLLGELFALENQGLDIALALCRQAVELDDSHWAHWLRLGRVQVLRGDKEAALAACQRSLRLNRRSSAALELLGDIYTELGKAAQARRMYERLQKLENGERQAEKALVRLRDRLASKEKSGVERDEKNQRIQQSFR